MSLELLHRSDDFGWFEPRGVVDIDVGLDDGSVSIHDKCCRDGQFKVGIALGLGQINPGAPVKGAQIFRQLKHQPKLARHMITDVAQHFKGKRVLFDS